ncbi:putative pectate lyase P18 [Sesamum angolense]|uniref:Pectate lyase P18 n=1 Tax=Sesamum angolense TaxID=2727404 RepID=A0AAE1XEG2_9LAMI|nr:putative pectate lyase P18 [Sesamum angolense]
MDSPEHKGWWEVSDGDGISIFGGMDIWVDHCSLSNCNDGLIDAIHGSTAITISNNYFTHHDKVMLLGHSDEYTQDKNMQVTIAFNHFGEGLVQRMPSIDTAINFQVTKHEDAPESEWRHWNWRSEGDLMMNGAYFLQSGRGLVYVRKGIKPKRTPVFSGGLNHHRCCSCGSDDRGQFQGGGTARCVSGGLAWAGSGSGGSRCRGGGAGINASSGADEGPSSGPAVRPMASSGDRRRGSCFRAGGRCGEPMIERAGPLAGPSACVGDAGDASGVAALDLDGAAAGDDEGEPVGDWAETTAAKAAMKMRARATI